MGWLIWSNEHNAWWGPNYRGYTQDREEAGRYSFEEAKRICKSANMDQGKSEVPKETMLENRARFKVKP